MARPIKQGLGYFPFDVDFFSDEKMYAISGEFGIKGEITTIKLLCAVYRNGYFIEWTEMLKYKLLKELPGVSADLLDQIIHRLVKWDFFDKGLFNSASILTSKGIQRRYQAVCAKMHRKNAIEEYCLIDQQPQPDQPTQPVVQRQPAKPAKVPPEPPVSKSKPDSLDQMIEVMLTDTQWNEPVCMRYELTADQFKEEIADFKSHCTCYDKHPQNLSDAKRHFCSWLSQKKYSGKSNKRPTVPKPTGPATYEYDGFGSKDN